MLVTRCSMASDEPPNVSGRSSRFSSSSAVCTFIICRSFPTSPAFLEEFCQPIFCNCASGGRHQTLVVGEVVNRHEHWPEHFVCLEQMPQIPSAMAAGGAGAGGIERFTITRMLPIAEPHRSGVGESERVAAVTRRHHAIEQVDTASNSFE